MEVKMATDETTFVPLLEYFSKWIKGDVKKANCEKNIETQSTNLWMSYFPCCFKGHYACRSMGKTISSTELWSLKMFSRLTKKSWRSLHCSHKTHSIIAQFVFFFFPMFVILERPKHSTNAAVSSIELCKEFYATVPL